MEERGRQDQGCRRADAEDDDLLLTDTPLLKPEPGCTITRLQLFSIFNTLFWNVKHWNEVTRSYRSILIGSTVYAGLHGTPTVSTTDLLEARGYHCDWQAHKIAYAHFLPVCCISNKRIYLLLLDGVHNFMCQNSTNSLRLYSEITITQQF